MNANSDNPAKLTDPAELVELIEAYNRITERLKRSHDLLQKEVARLTAELSEKNKELARKNRLEALGEMAAGVAHEIRNPLGGIEMTAGLLARDLAEDPGRNKLVRRISEGVSHVNRIVEGMLDFTSDRPLQKCPAELAPVIEAAVGEASPEADRAGVTVTLRTDVAEQVVVDADVVKLQRVFTNLLLNAVQACEGGGEVTVEAELAQADAERPKRVVLTVRDTGHGISQELAEKIFNPFFTTRDTGVGLGLAIVHRVVTRHDGSVRAGNNPDGPGAFFRVELNRLEP